MEDTFDTSVLNSSLACIRQKPVIQVDIKHIAHCMREHKELFQGKIIEIPGNSDLQFKLNEKDVLVITGKQPHGSYKTTKVFSDDTISEKGIREKYSHKITTESTPFICDAAPKVAKKVLETLSVKTPVYDEDVCLCGEYFEDHANVDSDVQG